jgi:hypothetical protein
VRETGLCASNWTHVVRFSIICVSIHKLPELMVRDRLLTIPRDDLSDIDLVSDFDDFFPLANKEMIVPPVDPLR